MKCLQRLRRLLALVDVVPWTCQYCGVTQETPLVLWTELKVRLLCCSCACAQSYPDWIDRIDPEPYRHVAERRARR